MKRFLLFVLTISLIFSLAACGDATKEIPDTNGQQSETSESEKEFPSEGIVPDAVQYAQIGDKISTDRAVFILQRFEFADALRTDTILAEPYGNHKPDLEYYFLPASQEILDTTTKTNETTSYRLGDMYYIVAAKGRVFASMSFTIENVGTTELKECIDVSDGSTNGIYGYVELQYGKYLFRDDDISSFYDCTVGFQESVDIDVMEPPHECRGYISVPEAVMNDTVEPLFLNVYLPNEAGEFETFTYQLR